MEFDSEWLTLGKHRVQLKCARGVVVVSQTEVDMHFGVYERMLAEKLGAVPPIQ
ncbi:hypothetical protein [Cupriavidus sp. CuC1]|uniref:hypothetical protein n=1 Tax=Cupriavidus sp. CuC1 TaxID=3373131 RepID=UPI0037D15B7E